MIELTMQAVSYTHLQDIHLYRCRSYPMSREEYPISQATQDRKISMPPTAPPTMNFGVTLQGDVYKRQPHRLDRRLPRDCVSAALHPGLHRLIFSGLSYSFNS